MSVRRFSGAHAARGPTTPPTRWRFRRGQLVAGDVDGDGLADLCSYGSAGAGTLTVLFGDGRGNFGRAVHSVWPGTGGRGTLVAASFSQNQRVDLALHGRVSIHPD